jgi:hypothetical protein
MIERLYPGVYLAEVEFGAKPIDGVPTTQPGAGAPEWTDFNSHDPGITLVELLNFATESLLYRTDLVPQGSVRGLRVQTPADGGALQVSPGLALDATGQATGSDLSATTSKYIGETEKRLGAVFGDAAPSGTVLRHDDTHALLRKPD